MFRVLVAIFLLLFGANLCRGWFRPATIKSPDVRARFDTWRQTLGTGPFLAAHVALPVSLGVTGLAAAMAPQATLVPAFRVALLASIGLYLTALSLLNARTLRQTQAGSAILRSLISVTLVAFALGAFFGIPLLAALKTTQSRPASELQQGPRFLDAAATR